MQLTDDELEQHLRELAFEEECELFVSRRGAAGYADRRSALDELLAQFEAR